jgi:hypothetical protein
MRLLLIFIAALAVAQEHSGHAVAGRALGAVEFPTSCNAPAQAQITRAIALLHSFGYEESRRAFQAAADADSSCGIALWGVSRTWYHPVWPPPTPNDLQQGAAALARARATGAKTARERDYIASVGAFYQDFATTAHAIRAKAYEQALDQLSARYPGDDEAAIFHALQLVAIGYLDPGDRSYTWQKRGAEILNRLLPRHPDHPGIAHYIIHATDYPSTAGLGLAAARAYARIAPDSSHALHMPSHIFTRLGLWNDSIASNIGAAKSGLTQAQRLYGAPGGFDQLHALDYLIYAYLQQARDNSARQVLEQMAAMPHIDENQFAAAYAFAASPARWALERHDWKAAAALELHPTWFPWNQFRNVEALVYYANAIGAALSGDPSGAHRAAARVDAIRQGLPATRDYDWSGSLAAQYEAATALAALAEGKHQEGLRMLRTAADHEDAVDKHPVTPGALLPAREILAGQLLETGDAIAALAEYETVLKSAPGRFNAVAGAAKAASQSGDTVKARAYARQLLDLAAAAEGPRPELTWAREFVARN